ncbi:putative phosphoglycerate mutase family protein [Pseudohyphozyma bogoriensis]|nr:putative phosphoglycerate mutase family protein [Pseudohyphozyma bogoriensis]
MRFSLALLSLVGTAFAYKEAVYLIRHGEKPADGSTGLTAQGEQRAQCLINVFSTSSGYDIGYIMAETPSSSGKHDRPYLTVEPLAESLGLTVDTSCDEDDSSCVAKAVKAYAGNGPAGSTLICWEHSELTDIASALGVDNPPDYPDDSYNLIWMIQDEKLVSITSEDCPGLDD